MARRVCVHGHFYQPPRENPWLDVIEPQPSAKPYPDWNARVTAECYRPNAAARIVDGAGRITRIVDNYERMSFDVGPTLMAWLEREAADVHAALIDADRRSRLRFNGHGSAIAQAYNHLIMPLANHRDRRTQVKWGQADFRHRFGRAAEGMWLPECAVDTASLEALAEDGIAFTILAPHQALRWRPIGAIEWQSGAVDTRRVYRCRLPSGRAIDIFFYDGATSQAVAFERLLADGGKLADRLRASAGDGGLGHIATDGETYGHHHRYGDMALAWALTSFESGASGARLTNYGELRAHAPASWEVEIVENSSWSCAHGVARWCDDCGCSTGGRPGWNQRWRKPLRDALDWLRDRAIDVFERASVFRDPWAARDDFIAIVLDRGRDAIDAVLGRHLAVALDDASRHRALELLELQRNAMLMYTSCGWFFDDISGIETVQVMQYAARVCELAARVDPAATSLERQLVDRIAAARSNVVDLGDGRAIWNRSVAPARVGLREVVAHVAASALVGDAPAAIGGSVFCYDVDPLDQMERRAGKARLVAGTVRVRSRHTFDEAILSFAGLHLGEHHLVGGVKPHPPDEEWEHVTSALAGAFLGADLLAAQRILDRAFDNTIVNLGSLRGADRDRIIDRILAEPLGDAADAMGRIYDDYAPLMRWLRGHDLHVPEAFYTAAEFTLRGRLLDNLAAADPSWPNVRAVIAEAVQVEVDLDTAEVAYAAGQALHRVVDRLIAKPDDVAALESAARAAEVAARMKSPVDLWHAQNACWRLVEKRLAAWRNDPSSAAKAKHLVALAQALRIAA